MLDRKRYFLHDQALLGAITASLQRSSVYKPGVSETNRAALRKALRTSLVETVRSYTMPVSEETHVNNISALAQRVSAECGPCLADGHLRIGIAQKALNLYLKYLWCYGCIPTPPHCPFDSRVISRLPNQTSVCWTRLDDLDAYRSLVRAAEQVAGGQSLSIWELHAYQRA